MSDFIENYDIEKATDFMRENAGAVIVVDGEADCYKCLVRQGIFTDFIEQRGSYHDIIEKLWFHFDNSTESVVKEYQVFIPDAGKFSGKYSKRMSILLDDVQHTVQMNVYPVVPSKKYVILLDELDNSLYIDDNLTEEKVTTIQDTYLFSMFIDVRLDTINSISITEISDEVMHQELKYTDWRMKIKDMIYLEEQALFVERSDPEYLKAHFAPGQTSSFDCRMMNLEGKFIWVKLIFSRVKTDDPDDFRFVYMVQNIQESMDFMTKRIDEYEELALRDTLTKLFNHGRIKTELINSISRMKKIKEIVSLIMLDIDFFKKVNDNYGHHAGDTTLIHFANTIKEFFKDKKAVIGRWGGEEFVVLLYDAELDEAVKLAEELRNVIENEPFETVEHITSSLGVTDVTLNDTPTEIFERVDEALYEAKAGGRNRVVVKKSC
ncbi:MAG: GGDEF domain-containing protein [Ruminococcus sp.]|nr:GGDEF domain-containing protein [Ruminococcus sp.]